MARPLRIEYPGAYYHESAAGSGSTSKHSPTISVVILGTAYSITELTKRKYPAVREYNRVARQYAV